LAGSGAPAGSCLPDIRASDDGMAWERAVLFELEANGYRFAGSYDELPWQHLLFFEVG
jgi:hypothetical protein